MLSHHALANSFSPQATLSLGFNHSSWFTVGIGMRIYLYRIHFGNVSQGKGIRISDKGLTQRTTERTLRVAGMFLHSHCTGDLQLYGVRWLHRCRFCFPSLYKSSLSIIFCYSFEFSRDLYWLRKERQQVSCPLQESEHVFGVKRIFLLYPIPMFVNLEERGRGVFLCAPLWGYTSSGLQFLRYPYPIPYLLQSNSLVSS